MKVIALLNRDSGTYAANANANTDPAQQVADALSAAGVDADVRSVAGDQLDDEARAAVKAGVDAVVAGGGDGTISTVAAALVGGPTPLGVLPLGTLNHFAKDLGISFDLAEAAKVIAAGNARPVDLARVNDRIFINNSSVGVYARAVVDRDATRSRLKLSKWPAMALAAMKTFVRAPMIQVRLDVEGKVDHLKTPLIFVGNNRYRLDLLKIGARDRLDEGVLSLYVARAQTRWGMLKLLLNGALGRLQQDRDFETLYPREVWMETRRSRLHLAADGEVMRMEAPLHYEILPRALNVLVPNERSE
ncbi:diacylglycerol/lipid kinase family protein [Lacipirellula parvula]|uniref:Transcription regulator n=1 Tax=Lacipirellula parvula TaxID=2650471 RepID=A0A5K7XF61_9BACT|nr:diacylglycerol kinase family protein [Lacipirellula parvula]BBO35440.1 transcription regulator [Lacipirellula parvula]